MAAATAKTTAHGSLIEALVAFQSELPDVVKNASADTGKYSYDYASLDVITPIIFDGLTAVDIAYVAVPHVREDGVFVLRASLRHVSGETIEGDYPLGSPGLAAQAIGSNITYARRYALLSMTGISPKGDDDDGKAGSEAQNTSVATKQAAATATSAQSLRTEMGEYINANEKYISGDDANGIMVAVTKSETNPEGLPPAKWTVAHLKAAKTQLETLVAARKAAA